MKRVLTAVRRLAEISLLSCLTLLLVLGTAMAEEIKIDETTFPDEVFRKWVMDQDKDKNGFLSEEEIAAVKSIEIWSSDCKNVKGIEVFTELKELILHFSLKDYLDLSKNTKLVCVRLNGAYGLGSTGVSNCPLLEILDVSGCSLTRLDLSNNANLKKLDCRSNSLESLDLSRNTNLVKLDCSQNQLTDLDVSGLTLLSELDCWENPLERINISRNEALSWLDCSKCAISQIVFGKGYTNFRTLLCSQNQLLSLDVSNIDTLEIIYAFGNQLTKKTLKLNPTLEKVFGTEPKKFNENDRSEYGLKYPVESYRNVSGSVELLADSMKQPGESVEVRFFRGYFMSKDTLSQKAGEEFEIPEVKVNLYFQYFLGWAWSPGATEPQLKSGDKITVSQDTVLYAVLKDKPRKLFFDLNGGTSGAPATMTGAGRKEIPSSAPVREGYYFAGWSASSTATEPDFKRGDMYWCNDLTQTLYAVWKPRSNEVSFDINGGTGVVPNSFKLRSGEEATLPTDGLIVKNGYRFLGWSTDKNAMFATYALGGKIQVTKDTVLYAVWRGECELVFNANGGTYQTSPLLLIATPKDTKVIIPAARISRIGYRFLGWATTENATTPLYKSGNVLHLTANITLYAVWAKD